MATWKKVITDGADLSDIGTPASDDKLLIQDTSDSNTVKYVDWAEVGGDTSLSNTDQTIAGGTTRKINLGTSGILRVAIGSTNSIGAMTITGNSSVANIEFVGDVKMDSGTMAGGSLRLEEFGGAGQSGVTLKAPTYLSADVDFVLPDADGTAGQGLVTDGSGNLSFATVAGSDTHLGNANLTANDNRTYDTDGNTLTVDISGGEFVVSDGSSVDTYVQCSNNVLELGDSGMTVQVSGVMQAKKGIEQDEANLTAAGAYGAGADITYLGASASSTTAGKIYYYNGTTWNQYSSSSEAPQKALLGVAIGTAMSDGFILRGFVNPNGASVTLTAGGLVYGNTSAQIVSSVPSSGFQRIMGHAISTSVVYFNPSVEYIDLT